MFFRILFLLTLFIFTQTAQTSEDKCTLLLSNSEQIRSAVDQEFLTQVNQSPLLKRLYFEIKSNLIKNNAIQACTQKGICSQKDVILAVKQAISKTALPNSTGYAFLISGLIANAALSAKVMTWINPDLNFKPIFASYLLAELSFISVSLLAPFIEPLASHIRRFTFSLNHKKSSELRVSELTLEEQADLVHSTYTLREQHATDRILSFRTQLVLNLNLAKEALESGSLESISSLLSDAALLGYRHFRDIPPSDQTLANAVHSIFLSEVSDTQRLFELTLNEIKSKHILIADQKTPPFDSIAESYYIPLLKSWLTLDR